MSIPDYRKFAISLILAPYLVNIQHLSNTEAFGKIKEWVLKCGKVRRLEPSEYYFDYLIGKAIERARISGIKPLKFEETLQHKCKALYDRLH
jgi:Primase X